MSTQTNAIAHEIWAASQLGPGEGIQDGAARIEHILELRERAYSAEQAADDAAVDYAALVAVNDELLDVVKMCAAYLSDIPAFGDNIGPRVSKAQLGCALNACRAAIARATSPA